MENTEITNKRKKAKKKKSKKFIVIMIVLIVLVIAGAAAIFAYTHVTKTVKAKLSKFDYVSLAKEDLDIDDKVKKDLEGYRNIVLLGIDTREGEDDETCRSDAIIVASIEKDTGKIKLTSVLRDSYLDVEESGNHVLDKLTHAHAYGGPVNTIRALNRNLDLNVDDFVRVNWRTVANAVDAVGGIEVTIKKYEINEMNKYIRDTNKNLKGDKTEIKKAGKQTINGIQAVTYCRIRKVGNGDTERAERMRKAVNAIVSKVKGMSLTDISKLADKILPEIKTSIDPDDMFELLKGYKDYEIKSSGTWPYIFDGAQIDTYGQMIWYDAPITLEINVSKLHEKLFKQKKYVPSDRILEYSKQIEDATNLHEGDSTL